MSYHVDSFHDAENSTAIASAGSKNQTQIT